MTELEFLKKQTIESHEWTLKVLSRTPLEDWNKTAEGIDSNLLWQAGHLVLTMNFHIFYLIRGSQEHVYNTVDLRTYAGLFNMGTNPADCIGKISPEQVMNDLLFMQEACIAEFDNFTSEELPETLEDRKVKHPFARTKYDAISWNFKHMLWHLGQVSSIQRILEEA